MRTPRFARRPGRRCGGPTAGRPDRNAHPVPVFSRRGMSCVAWPSGADAGAGANRHDDGYHDHRQQKQDEDDRPEDERENDREDDELSSWCSSP